MTRDILPEASLELLAPDHVSPGLLALVAEDAPTRAILCAGAGHFAMSNITLTDGLFIGSEEGAGEAVIGNWAAISDRSGEIVPAYGFTQAEREVASATGSETPKIAASR